MRYVKATFSDGSVAKRSSVHKHYTHASGSGRYASFATSLDRALKVANGREVVEVEEITAKEYRQKEGA
jgi:hypothetical protein